MSAPVCFVLTPFGKKTEASGLTVDFDAIYSDVIRPAIASAGLEAVRGDQILSSGLVQKMLFEYLIASPIVIADLTTSNANVLYELGIRHAARPGATIVMSAETSRLPFDIAPLEVISYRRSSAGVPADSRSVRKMLTERLERAASGNAVDSPLFQLFTEFRGLTLTHESAGIRDDNAARQRERLAAARTQGVTALKQFEVELGSDLELVDASLLVDLFLSYRYASGWEEMIAFGSRMPPLLAKTVLVQQQLALALNRAGRDSEAEGLLHSLLASDGPSSETYGLLGRIYKDRWERTRTDTLLQKAIDAYLRGFETDIRDPYPGINAVTLMELRTPPDERRNELIPVVRYAARRKVAARPAADYWDYATLLELAVLANDEENVRDLLQTTLAAVRERWEPRTTLRNLRLIYEARLGRGESMPPWMHDLLSAFDTHAA